MCGNKLAAATEAEPKSVAEKAADKRERAAPESPRVLAGAVHPVDKPREPNQPAPGAPLAQPGRRSDKWWVDEEQGQPTTSGGLSILGLSGADSGESGNYSYLFEGEQTSHAGAWVFLLVMLILAGVLYARWQPIRDYVIAAALSHSRPQPPPPTETKNGPPSAAATSVPPTTPAGSDAALQPAIATESKPDDNSKATPTGANSEPSADVASKPPGAKSPAAKKKAATDQADGESASAADEEKSSTAQKAETPQPTPGSELVSSGERYLYARGVARNCDQAVIYFNAAAAQQNPQAFSHLGALYASGECVPMDRAVAYSWFRRAYAREPGNRYFEQNLIMLWRGMTPAERRRATGRQ